MVLSFILDGDVASDIENGVHRKAGGACCDECLLGRFDTAAAESRVSS